METFVRVAESRSFSAVARATGTSQSHVSKTVAALELRLGARLLNRTTRHITLTEAGDSYYERCKAVLAAIEEAEREVRFGQTALHGVLRVNTSAVLAVALVQPALLSFAAENPGITVKLVMNDRRIDPVVEGIDLIVRSGGLDDSNLVVRRAGSARMGLFASPTYLAERHTPLEQTVDLRQHERIGFTGLQFRGQSQLKGTSKLNVSHLFSGDGRLSVSSAVLGHEAALAGAGIAMLPAFLVTQDIAARRLVQVLPKVALPSMEVSFLHPFGNAAPQRVSAFMEFAIHSWRETGRLVS